MAKTVDRVCEKYELKLRAGMMPARTDGDRERQAEAFRLAVERTEVVRKSTKEVLCSRGVFTIWWPYYDSFARCVAKQVARVESPDVQRLAARSELEVWVDRGLERSVLEAIGREVFDLDLTGQVQPLAGSPGPT
jgi:hypothetical protein